MIGTNFCTFHFGVGGNGFVGTLGFCGDNGSLDTLGVGCGTGCGAGCGNSGGVSLVTYIFDGLLVRGSKLTCGWYRITTSYRQHRNHKL